MKKKKIIEKVPPIGELLAKLNIVPIKEDLFQTAFTHSSYANGAGIPSNERLEFLGDSVISLIVCDFLYRNYPKYAEGKLAKLKSTAVSSGVLADLSTKLNLNRYILLGMGEVNTCGREKKNILEDLFEAFIGAYYLNFGLERTTAFVLSLIEEKMPELIRQVEEINVKTNLQEYAQSKGYKPPEYRLVEEKGPPHDKTFTVEVLLDNKVLNRGVGKSIKEAENHAAAEALGRLKKRPV